MTRRGWDGRRSGRNEKEVGHGAERGRASTEGPSGERFILHVFQKLGRATQRYSVTSHLSVCVESVLLFRPPHKTSSVGLGAFLALLVLPGITGDQAAEEALWVFLSGSSDRTHTNMDILKG